MGSERDYLYIGCERITCNNKKSGYTLEYRKKWQRILVDEEIASLAVTCGRRFPGSVMLLSLARVVLETLSCQSEG